MTEQVVAHMLETIEIVYFYNKFVFMISTGKKQ